LLSPSLPPFFFLAARPNVDGGGSGGGGHVARGRHNKKARTENSFEKFYAEIGV